MRRLATAFLGLAFSGLLATHATAQQPIISTNGVVESSNYSLNLVYLTPWSIFGSNLSHGPGTAYVVLYYPVNNCCLGGTDYNKFSSTVNNSGGIWYESAGQINLDSAISPAPGDTLRAGAPGGYLTVCDPVFGACSADYQYPIVPQP